MHVCVCMYILESYVEIFFIVSVSRLLPLLEICHDHQHQDGYHSPYLYFITILCWVHPMTF